MKKYSSFQVVTDNGTTEFTSSYKDALKIFAKHESATIYGQPTDENLPLAIVKSK